MLIDLPRGLISRSNTRLPRAKKDAECNSSLVPRSNTVPWLWLSYFKSVRDLVQWSLHFLSDPQALSINLALLRMLKSRGFGSLKMHRDLRLGLVIDQFLRFVCSVEARIPRAKPEG